MEYLVYQGDRARRAFASIAQANTWRAVKKTHGLLTLFVRVRLDDGTIREVTAEEAQDRSTVDPHEVVTAMDTTALGRAVDDDGLDGLAQHIGALIKEVCVTEPDSEAHDEAARTRRAQAFFAEERLITPLLAGSGRTGALQMLAAASAILRAATASSRRPQDPGTAAVHTATTDSSGLPAGTVPEARRPGKLAAALS